MQSVSLDARMTELYGIMLNLVKIVLTQNRVDFFQQKFDIEKQSDIFISETMTNTQCWQT